MKKVSFISLIVLFIFTGMFLLNNHSNAQSVQGWFKAGSEPDSYEMGLDDSVFRTGKRSAYIESVEEKIKGFGTFMQIFNAESYLGKRVRMTGYVKSENVDDWAGMWLRVDSKISRSSLSFDNMQDRPIIRTNDWAKYDIVLDVPMESSTLNFGVLLSGTGKVWFDDFSFEVVDPSEVEVTKPSVEIKTLPVRPMNIDFEE